MKLLLALSALLFLSPTCSYGQFPAVCNTQANLDTKTCCPGDCGESTSRGTCKNITAKVVDQWQSSSATIRDILRNAPYEPQKGTADSRYLWPTVVFENVCECSGHYGGVGCMECDFGWTGSDCNTKVTTPVVRKSFQSLTQDEKEKFVNATLDLKNEFGVWSATVEEPANYSFGTVTLQNISTYDLFVYLHNSVSRDGSRACRRLNNGTIVDFSHSGPAFPVWHRRYLLIVEKEFQRIMDDTSFGLPYWKWEEGDKSMFTDEYYGTPSNTFGGAQNVVGKVINAQNWNTVCDMAYYHGRDANLTCSDFWKPCNPNADRMSPRALQRGGGSTYLPNVGEVKITIAAPAYDAPNEKGEYLRDSPRESFRSRMEGWNIICSGAQCTGPQDTAELGHMHNNVHDWVRGHMGVVASSINDPVFNLHHCNVDRVLESWMKRFTTHTLPPYVPVTQGTPGHNRGDYMIPFFPPITPGQQYSFAEDWGYTYDSLVPADIPDSEIPDCSDVLSPGSCPICNTDGGAMSCINCTDSQAATCSAPSVVTVPTSGLRPDTEISLRLGLGLGLGLGIPLLVAVVIIIVLSLALCNLKERKPSSKVRDGDIELIVKS